MSDSGIHIKPSHRGRLTELKERTGKSEAELYNDGNPAHKKMVVFARNSRRWSHNRAGGGLLRRFDEGGDAYNTLLVNTPGGFVPASSRASVTVPYAAEQPIVRKKYADKWDRISNDRYKMANDALLRSGASKVDADRLARFLGAQSALEAGWVDDVNGHNYAGYMSNGKRMKFDNADAFWDYHVSNLDKKWPTWRNAQTIQEYYDTVNNTALGLTTKQLFDEYNRKHRDNPAYIYAPDWENSSYLKKLQGVYDKYITKYVKPLYSAGGLIEKYGADKIRAAINQMKCGGKMRRYDGETEPTGQMNSVGGYESPVDKRERVNKRWDPTVGFGPISSVLNFLQHWNKSHGEENEYWRAYLGLENRVPKMNSAAKTEWDDEIEAGKSADGRPLSDFYGTTPRMDQMIQVIADTLNTGKILRNYDNYKKAVPDLASKSVIEHMYKQGKEVLDNPDKWVQITEPPQSYLYDERSLITNERSPLGMLADFGMKWSPSEGAIRVHDTYDFPWYARLFGGIPKRPKEMKIRGLVKFDPEKGSVLLRDGLDKSKQADPIANIGSH